MSVNWGMANQVNPDPYGAFLDARDRREQRQERLETRERERTARSANEAWARALAADDLAAARDIAAKAGEPEAVQSVNEQVQRRVRQEAIRFNTELQDIARLPDGDPQRSARYAQLYQSTLQRASRWGLDRLHPEAMQQFQQMYPAPGQETAESLAQALQSSTESVRGLMTQEMTPEQWAEAEQARQPGEVRPFGSGGLYRNNPNVEGGYEVIREPRSVAAGGARSGAGSGATATGNRPAGSADQRGRVLLTFTNVIEAQEQLQASERSASQGDPNQTPYGRDWGARVLEAVPWDGGSAARMAGGRDYTAYETASRSFEQSIMPIFSGSAVTESEAQRFVRANLPRLGDDPQTLRQKAANRARIINAAAAMIGAEPPYPEAGYWSPTEGLTRPAPPEDTGDGPTGGGGQYADGIPRGEYPDNYNPDDVSTWPDWALEE